VAAGTDVLEQPFRADATHLMEQLRRTTSLPLAADESSVSAGDFFRLAAAGVVDYLVVKVTRSGGLWPTMQQLAIDDAAGPGAKSRRPPACARRWSSSPAPLAWEAHPHRPSGF
jgi:hypothetical protein